MNNLPNNTQPIILSSNDYNIKFDTNVKLDNLILKDSISDYPDIYSVLETYNEISGEIDLHNVLLKIIKIVINNTKTQNGYLILNRNSKFLIEAQYKAESKDFQILKSISIESLNAIYKPIINYVVNNNKSLVLNNVYRDIIFNSSVQDFENKPKSILCIPISNQTKLIGILYLENYQIVNAFSQNEINFLTILSSQLAISLENALLYKNIGDSEERFRTMISSTPVGIVISTLSDGKILYINEVIYKLFGHPINNSIEEYKTSDFYYNAEDRKIVIDKLDKDGYLKNHEVKVKNIDGIPFWVMISIQTLMYKNESAYIITVTDITRRKIAEEENEVSQREIARLSSKIHNSIKNKLDSISGRFHFFIKKFANELSEEAVEHLKMMYGLVNQSSSECKNILFAMSNRDCKLSILINEIHLRTKLSLSTTDITYYFHVNDSSEDIIVSPEIVQYVLDVHSEIFNDILRNCNLSKIDLFIGYIDNYIQFDIQIDCERSNCKIRHDKMSTFSFELIDEYSKNMGATFEIVTITDNSVLFKNKVNAN
ncbi:MAG: PAS domain S-box protein [Spirochaetota bacterium]|nr:PAS domain S-box protein [Spirochaetota bacterium]